MTGKVLVGRSSITKITGFARVRIFYLTTPLDVSVKEWLDRVEECIGLAKHFDVSGICRQNDLLV
jgi:hypothetical protein